MGFHYISEVPGFVVPLISHLRDVHVTRGSQSGTFVSILLLWSFNGAVTRILLIESVYWNKETGDWRILWVLVYISLGLFVTSV